MDKDWFTLFNVGFPAICLWIGVLIGRYDRPHNEARKLTKHFSAGYRSGYEAGLIVGEKMNPVPRERGS